MKRKKVYTFPVPGATPITQRRGPVALAKKPTDRVIPPPASPGKRHYTFAEPPPKPDPNAPRILAIPAQRTSLVWKPEGTAWHYEEQQQIGKEIWQRWTCDYGCKSMLCREPPGNAVFHTWDCAYWYNEGINETPF